MVGLVVVCHEDMGAELVRAAEMIVGKIEAVETVSVKQDSAPETLRDRIQSAIRKVDRKKGAGATAGPGNQSGPPAPPRGSCR